MPTTAGEGHVLRDQCDAVSRYDVLPRATLRAAEPALRAAVSTADAGAAVLDAPLRRPVRGHSRVRRRSSVSGAGAPRPVCRRRRRQLQLRSGLAPADAHAEADRNSAVRQRGVQRSMHALIVSAECAVRRRAREDRPVPDQLGRHVRLRARDADAAGDADAAMRRADLRGPLRDRPAGLRSRQALPGVPNPARSMLARRRRQLRLRPGLATADALARTDAAFAVRCRRLRRSVHRVVPVSARRPVQGPTGDQRTVHDYRERRLRVYSDPTVAPTDTDAAVRRSDVWRVVRLRGVHLPAGCALSGDPFAAR